VATEVFYKFEGDLVNAANRQQTGKAGVIPPNYGNGGPFFAANRQGYDKQALKFVRGERVETPVLIGDKAEWSLCVWVFAERTARTLFYERDGSKMTVANLVQLDADGTIYLDGEAGAQLTFEAWQFICISKNSTNVGFFVSGVRAASAAPVPVEAQMEKGLIGTNWTGMIDDLWVFNYNVLDYEVMTMYSTEEYSIALDGSTGHFTVTDMGSTTTLSSFQSNTAFTIDMWVKPTVVSSRQQPLFQQQKQSDPSDFMSLKIENNQVEFTYKGDKVSSAEVLAEKWNLISVSVSSTELLLMVTRSGSPTFSATEDRTTSLTAEASSKPLSVGYNSATNTFQG